MWFDPPEKFALKRDKKRMRRIAAAAEAEETSKIQKWLDLAAQMFDTDGKPEKEKAKQAAASVSDVA